MGRSALLIPALLLGSGLGGCVQQPKAVQEASPRSSSVPSISINADRMV